MPPKGTLELYEKARKMHKAVYKKDCWNAEKYKTKVGFQLQGIFKSKDVWTFKDLDDTQLNQMIETMENKIKKHPKLLVKLNNI